MGLLKYLVAVWVGVLVYALLSINWGAMGLSAYRQLEAERDKELVNIESLKAINRNLENAKNGLLSDRDTLTVYAREQGFGVGDEKFARIVGVGVFPRAVNFPGQTVISPVPDHTPDRFIRVFSFCAALTVLVCMGAYDFLKLIKDR